MWAQKVGLCFGQCFQIVKSHPKCLGVFYQPSEHVSTFQGISGNRNGKGAQFLQLSVVLFLAKMEEATILAFYIALMRIYS